MPNTSHVLVRCCRMVKLTSHCVIMKAVRPCHAPLAIGHFSSCSKFILRTDTYFPADSLETETCIATAPEKARIIRLVLDRFDREIREPNGVECLMYWAVANGCLPLVLECLGRIPALTSWSRLGLNWLRLAAKYGHQELVKTFVNCGIDVVAVAGRGMTAQHLAAQRGHNAAMHSILGHLRKMKPVRPKQLEIQGRSH
jgi:hypothetical protein